MGIRAREDRGRGGTGGGRSEERTGGGILKNAVGGRNRGKLNNCAYIKKGLKGGSQEKKGAGGLDPLCP